MKSYFVIAILLAGSSAALADSSSLPMGLTTELAERIRRPIRVESFRVEPYPDQAVHPAPERLGYWEIAGRGPALTNEEIRRFEGLILDPTHYVQDEKMCEFEPRHALRYFGKDSTTTDLLVCFKCSQLSLTSNDGSLWNSSFDPMRRDLIAGFNRVFNRGRANQSAVVFGYGERLKPPFHFSGEGGDTLYLNGFPYSPLRKSESHSECIVDLPAFVPSVEDSMRWALGQEAASAAAASSNSEEGMERALNIFSSSELVDTTYVNGGALYVKYKAYQDTMEVYLPAPGEVLQKHEYGKATRTNMARVHRNLIDDFWTRAADGSLQAFGDTYRFSVRNHKVEESLRAIEEARSTGVAAQGKIWSELAPLLMDVIRSRP